MLGVLSMDALSTCHRLTAEGVCGELSTASWENVAPSREGAVASWKDVAPKREGSAAR